MKELEFKPAKKGCTACGHSLNCECGFGIMGGEDSSEAAFVQHWLDKARAVKMEWQVYLSFVTALDPGFDMTPRERLNAYFQEVRG